MAVESTHSYVSQWSTDIPTNMGDSVMTVVGGRMVLTKGKDNSLDQIISSESEKIHFSFSVVAPV